MLSGHTARAYWNDNAQGVMGRGGFGEVRLALVQCRKNPQMAHVRAIKLARNAGSAQDLRQEFGASARLKNSRHSDLGEAARDSIVKAKGIHQESGAFLMEALPRGCTEYQRKDLNPAYAALDDGLKTAINLADYRDRFLSLSFLVKEGVAIDRSDDNDENRAYGFNGEHKRIDLMPKAGYNNQQKDLTTLVRKALEQLRREIPSERRGQVDAHLASVSRAQTQGQLLTATKSIFADDTLWAGCAGSADRKQLLHIPDAPGKVPFDPADPETSLNNAINAFPR
jgi:hypothetical protein